MSGLKTFLKDKLKLHRFRNQLRLRLQKSKKAHEQKKYIDTYDAAALIETLRKMGVRAGDNIMLHSRYEEFYNYTGSPVDVIEGLLHLLGPEGTLFMPSYGKSNLHFDVCKTPSAAGMITEFFRRKKDVVRSVCGDFSVAGYGPLAQEVTRDHINSRYGFDEHSAYYKFTQLKNAKVIVLGLEARSPYFTVMHCIDWALKDKLPYFKQLMGGRYVSIVVDFDGAVHEKQMIARVPCKINDQRNRSMYAQMPEETWSCGQLSNLGISVYSAIEAFDAYMRMAYEGKPSYVKPYPWKKLFVPFSESGCL